MSDRDLAIDLIRQLPNTATLEEIMSELYFRQKVEEGLADIRDGRIVSDEEVAQRIERWRQR